MANDYSSTLILDHLLFQVPFSIGQFYLSLHFDTVPANGNPSNEVTSVEYSRQPINFDSNYQNSNEIVWGPSTETWGSIQYIGLADSSSGGKLINSTSATIDFVSFTIVRIAIGQVTVTLT